MKKKLLINFIVLAVFLGCSAAFGNADYLSLVKAYADAMLQEGRDIYGEQHSPLFAVMLDRKTMRLFSEEEQKELFQIRLDDWKNWGIRNRDRVFRGADPHDDMDLYQILYALAEVTGDKSYAEEADRTIKWFFEHCQSPTTGLMAWGEHMGWDFNTETIIWREDTYHHGGELRECETHEFGKPWIFWERSFDLAPQACEKFALGLWNHQIHNQETGNFSRHAIYTRHHTEKDSEYPRHGGFYIAAWAEAYKRTKKPVFLKAIETLTTYFDNRRNPKTNIIPAESAKRSKGKIGWLTSNLSLAVDLWDGAEKVPSQLAEKMRGCASRTDKAFLSLEHDLRPNGKGFLKTIHLDTLEPAERGGYTGVLSAGDAGSANKCMLRYRQTKLKGYRKLILSTADLYLKNEPEFEYAIRPSDYASIIYLLLNANELTGREDYLARADYFAQKGVGLFLDDVSPLPKANAKYHHYEPVTGGDSFMMALLRVWIMKNRPETEYKLIASGR